MKSLRYIFTAAFVVFSLVGCAKKDEGDKILKIKSIKGIEVCLIKAGSFQMGSPAEEVARLPRETQHQVTLTRDFYISKYEVTNTQFCAFLNDKKVGENAEFLTFTDGKQTLFTPTENTIKYEDGKWVAQETYEDYPITHVNWYGADEFCRWAGGNLPTEAQWEYACRGGQVESLPFGIGNGTKLKRGMANYYVEKSYDTSEGGQISDNEGHAAEYVGNTTKVGTYQYANGYNLYDMHGNVAEWCADAWDGEAPYSTNDAVDPISPNPGSDRVVRGGYWDSPARECRSAARYALSPGFCIYNSGIRLVVVI